MLLFWLCNLWNYGDYCLNGNYVDYGVYGYYGYYVDFDYSGYYKYYKIQIIYCQNHLNGY